MFMRAILLSLLVLGRSGLAQTIPLPDVARHSFELTTLTTPNSSPFHLRASISDGKNAGASGEVDEYWVSPAKWRRTIRTANFSQTTIVNGQTHYEKDDGDYFPSSLRVLIDALFQPIPDQLQQALKLSKVKFNFYHGLSRVNYCDGNTSKIGIPPTQNDIFISVCFSGDPATISTIAMPGYHLDFKDRQPLGKLIVARHVISGLAPQAIWEAQVNELSILSAPDQTLFAAPEDTPAVDRFGSFRVSEEEARRVFKSLPDLVWPAVHTGSTSGVITVYVSIDRHGKPREAWPLDSNNPAATNPEIAAAACEQIRKWSFGNGSPTGHFVQLETMFTFSFKTQLASDQPTEAAP